VQEGQNVNLSNSPLLIEIKYVLALSLVLQDLLW
jgi:hypothetical protein